MKSVFDEASDPLPISSNILPAAHLGIGAKIWNTRFYPQRITSAPPHRPAWLRNHTIWIQNVCTQFLMSVHAPGNTQPLAYLEAAIWPRPSPCCGVPMLPEDRTLRASDSDSFADSQIGRFLLVVLLVDFFSIIPTATLMCRAGVVWERLGEKASE